MEELNTILSIAYIEAISKHITRYEAMQLAHKPNVTEERRC